MARVLVKEAIAPAGIELLERRFAVDAISSLGAVPLETDEWGLDAVVSGSQKALMTPPGLAFVSVSAAAQAAALEQEPRSFYFDWRAVLKAQARLDAAFTPAVSLVRALRDRFGITIANGQGELKGRIFRIGHIGYYDVFDVTTTLAAVEVALGDLGVPIERGGAVTRALEAYEGATRV